MKKLTKKEKEEFKTLEKLQKGMSYKGSLFGPIPKTKFGKQREKGVEKGKYLALMYLLTIICVVAVALFMASISRLEKIDINFQIEPNTLEFMNKVNNITTEEKQTTFSTEEEFCRKALPYAKFNKVDIYTKKDNFFCWYSDVASYIQSYKYSQLEEKGIKIGG
jgi:hypothetical protein